MSEARFFKIMGCTTRTAIPWELIEPHRMQALASHSQSLERLHERGGLSPGEAVAVIEDREWNSVLSTAEAAARLEELVLNFGRNR